MSKFDALAWVKDQTTGHRRWHLWWFLLPRWWRHRLDVCGIVVDDDQRVVMGACRRCDWGCGAEWLA